MNRILLLSVLAAGLSAAPAPAQPCGPLTFSFGITGPGCAGSSVLTGSVVSVIPGSCSVSFVATSPFPSFPLPYSFLAIGVNNPTIALSPYGYPGCTLLTTADVILDMPDAPASSWYVTGVIVPADPALAGATVYGQAIFPNFGGLSLSNGISISM